VFTAPVDLSSSAANPQVATDPDGDSVFAWEFTANRVQMRTMSSAGVLGPVLEGGSASGTADFEPRVAIDDQGDAVFAFTRLSSTEGVLARRLRAGDVSLSGLIAISPANQGVSAPEIATDANGDTVFTWVNFEAFSHPRVQARVMSSRGVLGPIRNLSALNQDGRAPQVAMDAAGNSVIAWVREDGVDGDNDIVQARTMTVNSSLGPTVNVSNSGGRAFAPDVATDEDGDTTFTWLRFDGVRDRAQARQMSAGGTLTGPVTLTAGQSALTPHVATDLDGDSVFTWEINATNDRIQTRSLSSAGTLGAVRNVTTSNESLAPQVASADSGASVFTWLRFDGAFDRAQVRTMNAAGTLAATVDLSAAGADAESPQVAIAATTGDVAATWERSGVVQASTGP
jgi:hypothetical protein